MSNNKNEDHTSTLMESSPLDRESTTGNRSDGRQIVTYQTSWAPRAAAFPREIVATILEFAIDDLHTYKHCCLVCKSWYYDVLISPYSTKIWHGLVRRHYPLTESVFTHLLSQGDLVNIPTRFWKYLFMKEFDHSRRIVSADNTDKMQKLSSMRIYNFERRLHVLLVISRSNNAYL